jgi:PAS domain S-box-containing protein
VPGSTGRSSPSTAGDPSDQLRLLVDAQTDYAIFILDVEGHVATWNPGAQRIKGYAADEIIGRHFSTFYTPEDVARAHPDAELEATRRDGRYEEEGWRVRSDGTRFWALVVITALRDARGELVGFGKVTRDLTERKAAEEQLRAAADALAESERRARDEADRMRARANALEDMGRTIVSTSDLGEMVQQATDAATELSGAAFGAFFYNVLDDRGESYMLYTISGVDRAAFEQFPMPRNTAVFSPTFNGEGVVRSDDITADPRYGRSDPHFGMPPGHLPVRSYLAVSVKTADGEVAGGLFFGHPEVGAFSAEDEEAVVSIAASAAVALMNGRLLDASRRESEARQVALEERAAVARVLQQSLLPPELPTLPGLEIGSHYQPGSELVGGDFYDVFALGEGRWGIVLGDVCGTGPEAASRTALTRHSVRTAAMFDHDPVHVLDALNRALMRASESDRFASAVFARVGPLDADGRVSVSLACGGHPAPIVVRAAGTVTECPVRGSLLGIMDEPRLSTHELVLEPGDTLVLYTDGLTEARRDGELFGVARLIAAIEAGRALSVAELASSLPAAAAAFAETPLHDDIAVVVLRVPA